MNSPDRSNRTALLSNTPFHILIILLVGAAAYVNSLYGPFHFDDLGISDKSYLWPRAFSSGSRQLVDLTFVLNHLLHGKQVFGYHLVNVTVHLAAAAALYGMIGAILTALQSRYTLSDGETDFLRRFLPFGTALLFVSHPIQTQAVSYIVQRYTSMAALFYFCSVMTFIRARWYSTGPCNQKRALVYSIVSLCSAVLAMRSKETAYTLPLMLLAVEAFLFQGRLLRNRYFLGAMLLVLLAIPLSRIAALQSGSGLEDLLYNIKHGTREELTYSRSNYLLTQFGVVAAYLKLLFLPINLNLDYDIPLQRSLWSIQVLVPLGIHMLLLGTAAVLLHRSRNPSSGPVGYKALCLRLISFGIVWFYLTLLVESSIIPILDVMFEHRVYLPSGGGILAVLATAAYLAGDRRNVQRAVWGGLLLVCCVFTVATIQRNRIWNNDLLLWEDTARKSPNKPRVLANLSAAYLDAYMADKAMPILIKILEIAPGMSDTMNNLGMALEQTERYEGRFNNGSSYLLRGRNVNPRYINSWFANTRNNLGLAYDYLGRPAEAAKCFETAVALVPSFELAWLNLYLTAVKQGNMKLAEASLQKLEEINPDKAAAISRQTAVRQ